MRKDCQRNYYGIKAWWNLSSIFFVFTLESGRVRPEDIATIKLVLESGTEIKRFSLVITKLSAPVYDCLIYNNAAELKKMITEFLVQINCRNNPPTILILKHKMELYDGENKLLFWNELNQFISMN